jgi:hypothetical protein
MRISLPEDRFECRGRQSLLLWEQTYEHLVPPCVIRIALRDGLIRCDCVADTKPSRTIPDLPHAWQSPRPALRFLTGVHTTGTSDVLAPMLVPDWYKQRPFQSSSGDPATSTGSEQRTRPLAVTSCPDTRKASLSVADNEALSKRVRGIEPPPEAWENVCL